MCQHTLKFSRGHVQGLWEYGLSISSVLVNITDKLMHSIDDITVNWMSIVQP